MNKNHNTKMKVLINQIYKQITNQFENQIKIQIRQQISHQVFVQMNEIGSQIEEIEFRFL